ncbi:MAG TPA: TolC family protein [Candidatus Kapabacteria bacterium]|nr:TolC family protein [Candidatus Kapabacteria bacterium]
MSLLASAASWRPRGSARSLGIFVATSIVCAGPSTALAQDTLRLSLDEAVRVALERSPSSVRAEQSERAAEARVRLADAAFGPDLRLSATPGMRYAPGAGTIAAGESRAGSDDPLTTSLSLGASSTLLLLDGSARNAERAGAELELEAARLARRRIAQDVIFRVTTAAIDVAVSAELIGVERENLAAERRQLERVDAFVSAGARPVAERYVQDAAVAAAELRLLTAERNLAASRIALALELGVDPSRPIALLAPAPATVDPSDLASAPASATVAARADLRAQRARIAAAGEDIRGAEAGSALSLGLTGGVGTNYSGTASGAFGDQFARNNPAATVGVSVTLPILDRGRSAISAEIARIEQQRAEQQLDELERQIAAQIELARLDLRTASTRLGVTERQLEAARRALEAEEARYGSGASTLAELAQVRARYVSAASQRVQAGYELVERRALLEYTTGVAPVPGLPE